MSVTKRIKCDGCIRRLTKLINHVSLGENTNLIPSSNEAGVYMRMHDHLGGLTWLQEGQMRALRGKSNYKALKGALSGHGE